MSKGDFGGECGTEGCRNIGMGTSIAVSHPPGAHRCDSCHDCLRALAPEWVPGVVDRDAYGARIHAIGEMDAETLRAEAAPILARVTAARDAYATLADLIGATVARNLVTAIVNAGPHVIDTTVLNWWAAYRWPEHHRATAPDRERFTFIHSWPITVGQHGIGTVRRVDDELAEHYIARDVSDGSVRPDLPAGQEPTYDTPHAAAQALVARCGRADRERGR